MSGVLPLSLLPRRYTVSRRTGYVLDPVTLSTSHAADRNPAEAFRVEVEVSSGSGTYGTVVVSGTVGGSPGSQALSVPRDTRRATSAEFDASTAVTITTSGFSGTFTLAARAVGSDGTPRKLLYSVATSWPGRLDHAQARPVWPAPRDGSFQHESTRLIAAYTTTWTPREGDEFVDDLSAARWLVIGVPTFDGAGVRHHWELNVRRAEA